MSNTECLITAAGGNATAIMKVEDNIKPDREWFANEGDKLLKRWESRGAEQSGFCLPALSHFEMAGGEFCGNGSRAAAVVLADFSDNPNVRFTVSGFDGKVDASVEKVSKDKFNVLVTFHGLDPGISEVVLDDGSSASVVDLGGIVHVVIEGEMPDNYRDIHRSIVDELNLSHRDAVGVIWLNRVKTGVKIDPVVWVREINSFFYETSCGSGTIAASAVTGEHDIQQVTGESIRASVDQRGVTLSSMMEVIGDDSL